MAGSSECSYVDLGPGSSNRLGISCAMCIPHFEKDICGDATKTDTFFQTCLAAIDAKKATCGADPSDASEMGLNLPSECNTLLDCNAGPCMD